MTLHTEEDLLHAAKICDAIYVCPKQDGVRKGPLVVYAGKDGQGRNLVGDIFFNFRAIEQFPKVVESFARVLIDKLTTGELIDTFDTICGIPEGGRSLGQIVALIAGKRFVYPTKAPKPTEPGKKQEYEWDLSQFKIKPNERIAVCEDVFNNFQNTDHGLERLDHFGAKATLLIGALNRSPIYKRFYRPYTGKLVGIELPVVAAVRRAFPEYGQDDPEVMADVLAGNIEFEVKKNWRRLCSIMEQHGNK